MPAVCLVVAGSALALAGSCNDTPQAPEYDRKALFAELASQVILTGYGAVAQDGAALQQATQALCAGPTGDTLTAARTAWRTVFLDWERTAAYRFGPATDGNLGPEMAFSPTNPSAIEAEVSGTDAIDANAIDALGAGAKGFYALEYLLFAGADATLSALGNARRCAYTAALADHVARTSQRLLNAWQTGGGNYANTLTTAGMAGNAVYPAELSAVSALITGLLTEIETVKDAKLGVPLGLSAKSHGVDPQTVECPYAHVSLEAMQANLASARAVWTGTTHTFDAYLRTRNPMLADQVLADLAAADGALAAVPSPFYDYVAGSDHSAGEAAHNQLTELVRIFSTDVSAALAVNLMFNANDGD